MAVEFTSALRQVVPPAGSLAFTDSIGGSCNIRRRPDSGLVKILGGSRCCKTKYIVRFTANIAVPDGGTAEAITAALALDGETLPTTTMIVTPAAVENFFNVSAQFSVVVGDYCVDVSVRNTSDQDIVFQNASLIVDDD